MFERITEQSSQYHDLEKMDTLTLLKSINQEDKKVALAVEKCISGIEKLVDAVVENMKAGGRLFYFGAGTSGRLAVLDASECPPTYGVSPDLVVGFIAGGDTALRRSVEHAEDDPAQGWKDLVKFSINKLDSVIGIAASGTTPYVVNGLKTCKEEGILTGCITCNPEAPVTKVCDHPIVAIVGPEFVTGSTRMKSGTAQKLILNMISTSVMIKLGRVKDNKMVDMQMTNIKLKDRAAKMIVEKMHIPYDEAVDLLKKYGSIRAVMERKTE
ncbi:MAG: N-acetylmuramic acid 6-phosphate etherase [Saprospiraceae bacterium]